MGPLQLFVENRTLIQGLQNGQRSTIKQQIRIFTPTAVESFSSSKSCSMQSYWMSICPSLCCI